MKLHIVGGFLGSGKTTAINQAAGYLASGGEKVAVITNDYADTNADNHITYANYSPDEIVINGSFSSNLDNLSDKIGRLHESAHPGYLFAESVGSCTDLVATVLKPLTVFYDGIFERLTLSVFVDARMFLSFLKGDQPAFSEEVRYIFNHQIAEADLLVLSKADLLEDEDFPLLKKLAGQFLQGRHIITQNSFEPQNIQNWLDTLESLPQTKRPASNIDYQIYSRGEAGLTWMNEELKFNASNNEAGEYAFKFIDNLIRNVHQKQLAVGHITFKIMDGTQTQAISFTAFDQQECRQSLSPVRSANVILRLNARIETRYEILSDIIQNNITALSTNGVSVVKSPKGPIPHEILKPAFHGASAFRCCEECICLKRLLERNALRREEGTEKALSELEDENFECQGLCGECRDGAGCCC